MSDPTNEPSSDEDSSHLSELGREMMGSSGGGSSTGGTGTGSGGGRWMPPLPEELATMLHGYEITKMLGRGGMGAVYMGRQISLDRTVAIKILSTELEDADAGFSERFKNEARAMAKLEHPGIVAVYDFGETESGLLFIVMQYVDGTDVAQMIAADGRLHTDHAMAVTAHVCDALHYAHQCGIIHRDIKPANIMVGYDGVVKVADFGLAKAYGGDAESVGLTQSGMVMGTMHYMAPEMMILGSAEADQRVDVYAVGVMLYHMLTGKVPHGMFELPSIQVQGLDPRYDGIIARAMREDRKQRYQDAVQLRVDLDSILTQPVAHVQASEEKGGAQAPAALPTDARPQRPGGGRRTMVTGVGQLSPANEYIQAPAKKTVNLGPVIFALVAILGAGGWWMMNQNEREAPVAVSEKKIATEAIPEEKEQASPKPIVKDDSAPAPVKAPMVTPVTEPTPVMESPAVTEPVKLVEKSNETPIVEAPVASDSEGWEELFTENSLAGWTGDTSNYSLNNGILLASRTAGDLISPQSFGDFKLKFDLKLSSGANNGIGIRCDPGRGDFNHLSYTGFEVQLIDDGGAKYQNMASAQRHGSIYSFVAPSSSPMNSVGTWNTHEIEIVGNHLMVKINGVTVQDRELPAGYPITKTSRKNPIDLSDESGRIVFFGGQGPVEFRNLMIREVQSPETLLSESILGEWWQRMEGAGDVVYRVTVNSGGSCSLETSGNQLSGNWASEGGDLVFEWENGIVCRYPFGSISKDSEILSGVLIHKNGSNTNVQMSRDTGMSNSLDADEPDFTGRWVRTNMDRAGPAYIMEIISGGEAKWIGDNTSLGGDWAIQPSGELLVTWDSNFTFQLGFTSADGTDVLEGNARWPKGKTTEILYAREGAKKAPADAVEYEGGYYKLFKEKLTWKEAQARCEEMGGRLPAVKSAGLNQFLLYLGSESGASDIWLGASDEEVEGKWIWSDGSELSTYQAWGPTQPNNKTEEGAKGEDYLVALIRNSKFPKHVGKWSDQPNATTAHTPWFICEWKGIGSTDARATGSLEKGNDSLGEERDLIALFRSEQRVLPKGWSIDSKTGGATGQPFGQKHISDIRMLPLAGVRRNYELAFEFTAEATAGSKYIQPAVSFPVGKGEATWLIGKRFANTNDVKNNNGGVEFVSGASAVDETNPMKYFPSPVVEGKRHRGVIRVVNHPDATATVVVALDNQKLAEWTGPETAFTIQAEAWKTSGVGGEVGLGANGGKGAVSYHSVKLRLLAAPSASKSITLFDGVSLNGWKVVGDPGAFFVRDGILETSGRSHSNLFYVGSGATPPEFTNFDLTMKVRTSPRGNSGVWLGVKEMSVIHLKVGFEAQISGSQLIDERTGSLYGIQPVHTVITTDNSWFEYRIVVEDQTVTTYIDGTKMMSWTQPSDWTPPARISNARLRQGMIGLQGHKAGPVSFKDIVLTPLP